MNSPSESVGSDQQIGINPTIVPVVLSANEVQFRAGPWAGPIVTFEDESNDGTLASVIEQFDGGASIEEVMTAVDGVSEQEVRQVVGELHAKNLIKRMDGHTEIERSPRPFRFSIGDLQTLTSKSILVVSSGQIGPTIVDMLVDAGVGTIYVRYRGDDGTAGSFDPGTNVGTWRGADPSVAELVNKVDLVLASTQQPWREAAARTNELAIDSSTPFAHAEVTGYDIIVGPTVIPGDTACYECYAHHRNQNVKETEAFDAFMDDATGREDVVAERLPFTQIAAGLLVTDIVNVLCYGRGFTTGTVITYNMIDLTTETNDVLRLPRCNACSELDNTVGRDALFTIQQLLDK